MSDTSKEAAEGTLAPTIKHDDAKLNEIATYKEKRRNRIIIAFLLFLGLICLLYQLVWWLFFSHYVTTDNAYVDANIVVVSSPQKGRILSYMVEDTFFVKKGGLLVVLDPTDYALTFEQAKAALALATRHVKALYEDVQQRKSQLALQEAKYQNALFDVEIRLDLVSSEAISIEEFQHASAELQISKASLELARHQLQGAVAALGFQALTQHPDIENARLKAIEAYIALQRCRILAPVSGYVAKRSAQLGMVVNPTTQLLAILPLNEVWVEANFKETQLAHVRIGQPVNLTADIYGSNISYHGKVMGILPGSGSVFSLLPPQNASGNWIKIVQRVPIRISLDPKEVETHPLVMGLSMEASIDISDHSGPMLSHHPTVKENITHVLDIPLEQVHAELDAVITNNLCHETGKQDTPYTHDSCIE